MDITQRARFQSGRSGWGSRLAFCSAQYSCSFWLGLSAGRTFVDYGGAGGRQVLRFGALVQLRGRDAALHHLIPWPYPHRTPAARFRSATRRSGHSRCAAMNSHSMTVFHAAELDLMP
jgi:hypothetical protein